MKMIAIFKKTFEWIPSNVFSCAYFTNTLDSEMRSKLFRILDKVLLGNGTSPSTSLEHLSATARAVGFTTILHTIRDGNFVSAENKASHKNSFKYMYQLFNERAAL